MKSSYHVEFRQIPRQLKFHVFRGTEGSMRHLTLIEWLTVCHVSSGEQVKQRAKVGPIGDM